jgi:peptidoglycan/xylan/chitin deacetylase (PgdA/CDA1 family)
MNQSMYIKMLTIVAACLYYSGLVGLGRWLIQRQGPRLIILNYHAVTGGNLRQHLLYFRRYYRLLHLEQALEELFAPAVRPVQDRRTPLVITFDDGYYDNYTECFALAAELHVPLTLFLIPGYVETGARFWWLEPDHLVTHTRMRKVTIEGQTYHLNTSQGRAALAKVIDTRIRFTPSVEEREAYLRGVRQLLDVPYAVMLAEKSSLPFSWAEVETMKRCAWISFGGHTMHHPILSYLADPTEAEHEVRESRIQLERHLQSPIHSFAYPVGQPEDIGAQGMRSVQKSGYVWAVTTIDGLNTPQTNPYLLHRFSVDVHHPWLLLAAKVSGMGKRVSNLSKFFTNLLRMPMRFLGALTILQVWRTL